MSFAHTSCQWCEIDSPVGVLLLAADAQGLRTIHFQSGPHPLRPPGNWRREDAGLSVVRAQLAEYFSGIRREFTLPLSPLGTPFQHRVWDALRAIPYGQTVSYGELARDIGVAGASRAVGLANGANPLPIVIPCHRVIGGDGSLTGFGGGLSIKRTLLLLEGAACVTDLFSAPRRGCG